MAGRERASRDDWDGGVGKRGEEARSEHGETWRAPLRDGGGPAVSTARSPAAEIGSITDGLKVRGTVSPAVGPLGDLLGQGGVPLYRTDIGQR